MRWASALPRAGQLAVTRASKRLLDQRGKGLLRRVLRGIGVDYLVLEPVRIAGLCHETFGPFQIVRILIEGVVMAKLTEWNGPHRLPRIPCDSDLDHVLVWHGMGDSLSDQFVVEGKLCRVQVNVVVRKARAAQKLAAFLGIKGTERKGFSLPGGLTQIRVS